VKEMQFWEGESLEDFEVRTHPVEQQEIVEGTRIALDEVHPLE
jgi:hypothetical protein